MVTVGERIAQVRTEKGLTQTQLAETAGTSQSAISQIENGDRMPSFATVNQLAVALRVTAADLMGVSPEGLDKADAVHFRQLKNLSVEGRRALDEYLAFLVKTKGKDRTGR